MIAIFIPRFNVTVGINSVSDAPRGSFCINSACPPEGKSMNKYVQRTVRGKNAFFAVAENTPHADSTVSPSHKLIKMLSEDSHKLHVSAQSRLADTAKAIMTDANGELSSFASANSLKDYGASCTILNVTDGKASFLNAGNVSGFFFRGGVLRQMSENHSERTNQVPAGTQQEDNPSPDESGGLRLTKYVGHLSSGEPLTPFISEPVDVDRDDVFLICSGELCENLPQSRISYILSLPTTDEKMVRRLINEALARGAVGDISVMLIRNGGKPFIQKNTVNTFIKTGIAVIVAAVLCAFIISSIKSCSKKPAILQEETPDLPIATQPPSEFMTQDGSI